MGKDNGMKTKRFDLNKRKLFFAGALSFASLKLAGFKNVLHAKESAGAQDLSLDQLKTQLEGKIAEHDHEIERLKAITAIQNTMAHYEVIHLVNNEIGGTPEVYALWRDDVTVEVSGGGIVRGAKDVENYWKSMVSADGKVSNGCIFFHMLATPCIQVAGDGKTAKVIWHSPGFECDAGPQRTAESDHMAVWCYGKYACDFIKHPQTGEWKIWHSHWFRTTRNDYHLDFVEYARKADEAAEKGESILGGPPSDGDSNMPEKPRIETLPTVFHETLSAKKPHHPFPIDPEPYETYDGDFRWPYGGKEREDRYGVNYAGRDLEKIYNLDYPNQV
jgi:hypothetical protein